MGDNISELLQPGQEILSKEHPARKSGEFLLGGINEIVQREEILNREARKKLPSKIGVMKQVGYGALLYPITILGGRIGSMLFPVVGGLVGRAVGAEVSGVIYNQVLRRFDKDLPALEGKDYLVGALVGNPAIAGGLRETYNGFRLLANPDAISHLKPAITFTK